MTSVDFIRLIKQHPAIDILVLLIMRISSGDLTPDYNRLLGILVLAVGAFSSVRAL
jgi:hypothetical protein